MLDTIVYIPTILAYVFISLLIVILCFIVVYVSHRIYACIYDNLPVAHAAISTILSMDYKDDLTKKSHSGIALRSPDILNERKQKTALRIIVTLAPTYLAYVTYESSHRPSIESDTLSDSYNQNKIIKYYDRLSQIPITEIVSTSDSRKFKQKNISKSTTGTSIAVSPTSKVSIKSVATSTTRLLEAPETSTEANNNDRVDVAAIRNSPSILRPSVTFANAVNALANRKKITTEENVQ